MGGHRHKRAVTGPFKAWGVSRPSGSGIIGGGVR
ncbi:MAG: hypothetical protein BWY01_01620 [Synergistetes bacterium ADurb.Bin155]|jgi:hypothetical protein|nr:MAG: hypothetical protein BWY01_01620 [Synergistetes bacterium ADurb.Bin155]